MNLKGLVRIEGLLMPTGFAEPNIRFAMNYDPQPDDVIIATYPKSGTNWTQYIVSNIFNNGDAPKTTVDFMLSSPMLELSGADAVRKMSRPGALMSHLPFNKRKHSTEAKYIFVARNPYDSCVSLYHMAKGHPTNKGVDLSFEEYFNLFLSGTVMYGDYFDHLLSSYPHRNDPNVLFLTYENIKKDTRHSVIKIADFLGEEYGNALRRDEALVMKILDSCTVENMKPVFRDPPPVWIRKALHWPPERRVASLEWYRGKLYNMEETDESDVFVRKGVVGDWKNHFSPEQIERMKARIAEKTADTPEVMNLWEGEQIPL